MKRIIAFGLVLILALVAGPPALAAVPPSEGIVGNSGELLSDVVRMAGSGNFLLENGGADAAAFRMPQGVLALSDGSVLIADSRNHLIRRVASGRVETFAGFELLPEDAAGLPEGFLFDGTRETAVFNEPSGLAADAEGNIYVADAGNHAIRVISADGTVTTVAGDGVPGARDGAEARFNRPQSVAIAADGTIYVADTLNHAIRRVAPDGTVSTLNKLSERTVEVVDGIVYSAGDFADGPLAQAKFNEPSSIVLDERGNLYVSDSGNHLIRYIDLTARTVTTVAGVVPIEYGERDLYALGGREDGDAAQARFHFPKGLALTADGGLVIADSMNHALRFLHGGNVSTLAGSTGGTYGRIDGINGHNLLHAPTDVSVALDGGIYIADTYNNQIRAFRIFQLPALPESKEITVVAGDRLVEFDAQPELVNNRTMVPVRAVAAAFGYTTDFEDMIVRLSLADTTVELKVGSTLTMRTSRTGEKAAFELDVAPYVEEERIYVPLRFLSEQFGWDVQWHAPTRTVIIREKIYGQ